MRQHPNTLSLLTCDEMIDLGIQTPAMLVQLEDDLGPQEVWDLVNAFGGRSLHLPSTLQSAQSTTREQVAPESLIRN